MAPLSLHPGHALLCAHPTRRSRARAFTSNPQICSRSSHHPSSAHTRTFLRITLVRHLLPSFARLNRELDTLDTLR
jgi:hypothetical protein